MECPHFATFLKIYSFFYLVPFQVRKSKGGEYYELQTSAVRKIICALIHLSVSGSQYIKCFCSFLGYFAVRHDIISTFYVFSQFTGIVCISILMKLSWRNQPQLEKFLSLTSVPAESAGGSKSWTAFIVLLIGTMSMAQGVLAKLAFGAPVFGACVGSLLSPILSSIGVPPASKLEWLLLTSVETFIFSTQFTVLSSGMSTMLVLSLSWLKVASVLWSAKIEDSYGNVESLLQVYKGMEEASVLTKELFGDFVVCYYVTTLSYMAQLPQVVFASEMIFIKLIMAFYMVILYAGMGAAAQAHSLVEASVLNCVNRHQWNSSGPWGTRERLQLVSLAAAVESQPIGISCSFFTITKKFLSSTLGLIVTFSIVTFQMSTKAAFWDLSSKN